MGDDWATASEVQEANELIEKVDTLSLIQPGPAPNGVDSSNESPPQDAQQEPSTNTKPPDDEVEPSAADVSLMRKALCRGIVETDSNVEVLQRDPNSPLYSVKTFEALNLRPELLRGIYSMGFKLPSKIQETALPTLLAEPAKNLIAQSQSGTGKTAAFSLAMLSRIDPAEKCTQALCLSPTYELALQTADSVRSLGQHCTDITIRIAVKGETLPRGMVLDDHIVIGTPGKVVDWVIKQRSLDLRRVRVFVLDEADVMIDTQGHQDQSVRIHKLLPEGCQMLLFSATYDVAVMRFAEAIIADPKVILKLRKDEETLSNIRQMYVECGSSAEKYSAIANIYSIPIGQSIFFCRTKANAVWLHQKMVGDGHKVALLTGDLTPEERLNVLTRYRQGLERVLICTNVLSRGIDVEQVTLVVNYDLPETTSGSADCETYLHRIGRTGRFGKTGNAINIVDGLKGRKILDQIERHFGIKIEKLDYRDFNEIDKLADD